MFVRPTPHAFSRISLGNVPCSSSLPATGMISFLANSRAVSTRAFCSSVRLRSNGMGRSLPATIASIMAFFRHAAILAWKDLRVEFRTREIVYTMLFFAAMLVLIFSFAFSDGGQVIDQVAGGILWIAVTFSGTL